MSDLLTSILPIVCPPTMWAISLEFCRKPYTLDADDFLGACYRKAMTPQIYGLYFFPKRDSRDAKIAWDEESRAFQQREEKERRV